MNMEYKQYRVYNPSVFHRFSIDDEIMDPTCGASHLWLRIPDTVVNSPTRAPKTYHFNQSAEAFYDCGPQVQTLYSRRIEANPRTGNLNMKETTQSSLM